MGEKYYESFLKLFNNYSNDYQEDIETLIYDNLKEDNNSKENENFIMIMDLINKNIIDEESKKGFLALLKQSFVLGKLRSIIVSIFYFILIIFKNYRKVNILLEFWQKKADKSTFVQKLFKDCETYPGYGNGSSDIGLNFYTFPNIENFIIIDGPGKTENDNYQDLFLQKGYTYSKLLIYLIGERFLDEDYIRYNKYFEALIKFKFKLKYKIPLLILLNQFDNYCEKVKKEVGNLGRCL